tara:strand:+ start:4960 stop:5184 length:225 start_codon:yes stop_codon:yes gene_type:complete
MKCWCCQTELIWGGDHDLDLDVEMDYDGHTIVTNLSCPKCDAFVEVYHGKDSDQIRKEKEEQLYGKVVSDDLKE